MSQSISDSTRTLAARGRIENRQAIVEIGISPLVDQAKEYGAHAPFSHFPINTYRALIDTGAQRSCLSRSTIAAEHLHWHGKKAIKNVHDQNLHYLFWVNMGFWCERGHVSRGQESNKTYYALDRPVEVIDIAPSYWFDAIIGMDIIGQSNLTISRDGFFEMAFS
ncbi:hypothetical protein [Glacieibacterium sp.]|uniref:hypothetical protein n=1 Tax=Glacieibacterium sp. TaxID=2860237 RepID=UPI003AFFA1E4